MLIQLPIKKHLVPLNLNKQMKY